MDARILAAVMPAPPRPVEIRECWGSEAGHFLRALAILERHAAPVPWREIGERVYPLIGLNEALADAGSICRSVGTVMCSSWIGWKT